MDVTLTMYKGYVDRDVAWIDAARGLAHWKAIRQEAERNEKQFEGLLKQLSKGACSKGGGFVYDYSIRKGTIDYTAIPELNGVDLEQYRKESVEVWKLSMALGS